jgi:hypothetical protein
MSGLGIGAGGLLGVAVEDLAEPVQTALSTATTGGTITAGTYKYIVTAINALGETLSSNEQTIVTTGATSTVTVSWGAVTGATGYKLYKTASGGATNTELLYKTVGVVVTDIDTAPGAPAGALPTANTALTSGIYTAPTKFVPFRNESLKFTEETVFRRPIRQSADVIGAVAGNEHAEGDVEMEAMEDCLLYFMLATRAACVKTGTTPNFTYTFTPLPNAIPTRTLTIVVVRAGEVFAYVGCTVGSVKFGIDNGLLTFTAAVVANSESTQSSPTATWPTTTPFGAGQYSIEFPSGTPVVDTDTFEITIEDNPEIQFRLKSTGRGGDFTKFGERDVTMTAGRDFTSKTDYTAFKAVTSQTVTITATKGVNNSVSIVMPVTFKESYEVNLSGQGDLVRGNISYRSSIDGSGNSFSMVVKSQEVLPV